MKKIKDEQEAYQIGNEIYNKDKENSNQWNFKKSNEGKVNLYNNNIRKENYNNKN